MKPTLFCTIAIGDRYLESAVKMAKDLNKYSNSHHFVIVTDIKRRNLKNTSFVKIPKSFQLFIDKTFNYTLKFYPLYLANNMDYTNIIYIDSDWRIRSNYKPELINDLFNYMDDNKLDMLFERPSGIGNGKWNDKEIFWCHKIDFYKLKETNEYDSGHVCNEQFLVFKKNDKFRKFVQKFEELSLISTQAQLWPFAEGLEIGMSMAVSKMNFDYLGWQPFIREIFEFNSNDGFLHVRF